MTGRYKAYAQYQDSGIEWLKDMPIHWQLVRVKHLFKRVQRPVRPEDGIVTAFRDGEVTLRSNRRTDGFTNAAKEIGYQGVRKGDLLVHAMDGFAGAIGMSDSDGKCSPVCSVCVPWDDSAVDTNYYGYLVRQLAVTDYITSLAKGIRERSTEFRFNEFSSLPLAVPPYEEQQNIASFLDHETAKIDILITKQEKLIELLKEKRQAVISHAVTKGLNPNAPMKDSGVEWLGEVPEHWAVAKLSYRYEVLLGKMLDEKKITGDFLGKYLRNTDVQWGTINTDNLPVMDFKPTEIERYSVKKGDLIVCEGGEIGRSAIWTSEVPCFYQKALHRLRPYDTKQDCSNFMYYVMFDAVHQERFSSGANKATIAHLPAETFRQYRFAYPPHTEQMAIAKYLEEIEHKFDSLQLAAKAQVELLTERKTALISAAVTGKIDVRDWQPQGVQG
ncbi:restriction endonuclease subunit S [Vibrio parahaemolyticus]|nr:restriction endonuclease subunit S [Vibrio parahaemolyticus]EHK9181678.1 restriction endonuclease subunit S [Vibrio parahaemolyticus]